MINLFYNKIVPREFEVVSSQKLICHDKSDKAGSGDPLCVILQIKHGQEVDRAQMILYFEKSDNKLNSSLLKFKMYHFCVLTPLETQAVVFQFFFHF